MKAWRVDCGDEWCVLIFAPSRTKAKAVFKKWGPSSYNYDYEWTDIHAVRHTPLDGMVDCEKIYESHEDLPEGIKFWDECEGV